MPRPDSSLPAGGATALVAIGHWGFGQHRDIWRLAIGIGGLLLGAALWGTLAVPDDPTPGVKGGPNCDARSGKDRRKVVPLLQDRCPLDGQAEAYVCDATVPGRALAAVTGCACQASVMEPEGLRVQLEPR